MLPDGIGRVYCSMKFSSFLFLIEKGIQNLKYYKIHQIPKSSQYIHRIAPEYEKIFSDLYQSRKTNEIHQKMMIHQ
jgi:hypothetical protein